MATELTPETSLVRFYNGDQVLKRINKSKDISSVSKSREIQLSALIHSRGSIARKVILDNKTAKIAVGKSVKIGVSITARLKDVLKAVVIASRESIISPSTNLLNSNGTRLSALNIQTETNLLLTKIDRLAKNVNFKGGNLISSDSPVVHVQTSLFGGLLAIDPQPMDLEGLGLVKLNLLSSSGVNEALSKLDYAILLSVQRLKKLEVLKSGLYGTSNVDALYQKISEAFGYSELPLGTLVNLIK